MIMSMQSQFSFANACIVDLGHVELKSVGGNVGVLNGASGCAPVLPRSITNIRATSSNPRLLS